MIKDWRTKSGNKNLPFLLVQLAGYRSHSESAVQKSGIPLVREAQAFVSRTVPSVALATAVDLYDGVDIHPRNKKDVALRLVYTADEVVYRVKNTGSAVYKGSTFSGSSVNVTFSSEGVGLFAGKKVGLAAPVPASDGKIIGFALAGADGVFHNATGKINADKKTVTVTSKAVPKPLAVRYGWANNPACNLYNSYGLPVIPFRSDTKSAN